MSSSSSPEQIPDLKHIASNPGLTPHKVTSQHLQISSASRAGSRSPSASIPSSPTSVQSSSSAIFERDIEPIVLPLASHDPHRIPRAHASEQLEQCVPSVLDSAAEALAISSPEDGDHIAVMAPAAPYSSPSISALFQAGSSGFASPHSSSAYSRSPSPNLKRTSLLLNLPSPGSNPMQILPNSQQHSSPTSATLPTATLAQPKNPGKSTSSPPILASEEKVLTDTPKSAYYSLASSPGPSTPGEEHKTSTSSPKIQAREQASPLIPQTLPLARTSFPPLGLSPASAVASPISANLPPSPSGASKRLSFMSYTDLLASTPILTQPLSSLTSAATAADPPPHLPSVTGFAQSQNGVMEGRNTTRDSMALLLSDEVGGEWEREGLGKGLEERLEALMLSPPASTSLPVTGTA